MRRKIFLKLTVSLMGLLLLFGTVYVFYYLNKNYNIGLFCTIYELTGLYCPGCGMTRAVISLLNLDFYQAFRYNAFSIFLLPLLGIYLLTELYSWVFEKENVLFTKTPEWIFIVIVIMLILFGILRNFSAFSFLAPTKV